MRCVCNNTSRSFQKNSETFVSLMGVFFSLFFPLWFSGCSVPHDCRVHRGAHSCPPRSQPSFQNRLLAPIVFISAPCSHMRPYPPNPNQNPLRSTGCGCSKRCWPGTSATRSRSGLPWTRQGTQTGSGPSAAHRERRPWRLPAARACGRPVQRSSA